MGKVIVKTTEESGNIYAVMANASRELQDKKKSDEMFRRVTTFAHSYKEALDIIGGYVELEII